MWIGIFGDLLLSNGELAPVGSVVDVVDGAGNIAGWAPTETAGTYGYLPIYLDDPASPEDEGADEGEVLRIRVNGLLTGATVKWTSFGDLVRIDLTVPDGPLASGEAPKTLSIGSVGPNPFNSATTVKYFVPERNSVELAVYNVAGQRIKTLVAGVQPAGEHAVIWDGKDESGANVASGLYICRLQAGPRVVTATAVLVK
jgi:hypothetical protein